MKRLTAVLLILCLSLSLFSCSGETEPRNAQQTVEPDKAPQAVKSAEMMVLGDNLMHMPVVNDGKQSDGSYNLSHIYVNFKEDIENADIAVIGQETVLGGEELSLSGYPLFNSPYGVGNTLASLGFDVVLHASNHIMDRNIKGIENTLNFWKSYPSVTVLGINESPKEYDTVKIIERNGLTFALLNYTYGTNGIPLPEGKEYMVDLIDRDKIKKDIKSVRDKVDFVVVFPHWGTEYSLTASSEQESLAEFMTSLGADAIIGSHPHVIEPVTEIESENKNRAVVYYSLGNFVSRQKEVKNLLGGEANLVFTKNGNKKSVKASFTPIVTQYDYNSRNFCVYKLKDYNDTLAAAHGINLYDGKLTKARFEAVFTEVMKNTPKDISLDY